MKQYFVLLLVILFLIIPATAYTFTSDSVSNSKIFRCQPSTVTANFNDPLLEITAVYLQTTTLAIGSPINELYNMSGGAGVYTYTYGNNNLTPWGNKSLSYIVTVGGANFTNSSSSYIFVYSDSCLGTGITNVSRGFGHYTNKLGETNASLINIAVLPFTDYLGAFFYLIILLIMCLALYLKNANIMTPLLFGMIGIGLIAINLTIADTYKNIITLLMIGIIAAILWKIFKS